MGRTVAVIWHVSFSIVAAGLFFFFVLPRWPELMGQTSPTLGLILRIVTGALIGLAALPVVFTLQRTKRPELATPEMALRLRTASISLHVLAGVLIVGTAVSEIWLSLDSFGPWLFGIYGAAAAIALLGIFAFYLAFVAELPPPPPKPVKTREKTTRRGRKKAEAESDAEESAEAGDAEKADDAEEETELTSDDSEDEPEADTEADDEETSEEAESDEGNQRPSTKIGNKRRGRRSRGEVAVED